jgi:hypothetical protein
MSAATMMILWMIGEDAANASTSSQPPAATTKLSRARQAVGSLGSRMRSRL